MEPRAALSVQQWYRNGGKVTHDHWKRIRKTLRAEIMDYLHSLPLAIDIEINGTSYKLVHAAPVEAYDLDPKYHNAIHFAVWKRLEAPSDASKPYTLIFGHTTTKHYQDNIPMEIWRSENCIDIDCGCGYPEEGYDGKLGRLACLRLDDGRVFYSDE